jgi:hypothetical protein
LVSFGNALCQLSAVRLAAAEGGLLALGELVTVLVDLDLDHGNDVNLALVGADDKLVGRGLRVVILGCDVLVTGELLALQLLAKHLLLGLVRLCSDHKQKHITYWTIPAISCYFAYNITTPIQICIGVYICIGVVILCIFWCSDIMY